MKCVHCPVQDRGCLGETVSRLCELARTRGDYRRRLVELSVEAKSDGRNRRIDMEEALSRINGCRLRGSSLPVSSQVECGCSELTECFAGHGKVAGRVTLQDCLACIAQIN